MTNDTETAALPTGYHVMPAIPPYFPELLVRASLLKTLPNGRFLLRDEEMALQGASYWIETDAAGWRPDRKTPTPTTKG